MFASIRVASECLALPRDGRAFSPWDHASEAADYDGHTCTNKDGHCARPRVSRALSTHRVVSSRHAIIAQIPVCFARLYAPLACPERLPAPTWAAHPLHALQVLDKSAGGRFVSPPVWDRGPQLAVLLHFHVLFVGDNHLMATLPHGPQRRQHLRESMPRLKSATQQCSQSSNTDMGSCLVREAWVQFKQRC